MSYVDLSKTVEKHRQKKVLEKIRADEKPRKKKVFLGVLTLVVIGLLVVFKDNAMSLFSPVSIVSNLARSNLKSTDGRTNILVLGKDARSTGVVTSVLTDTLLFASIDTNTGSVALISLPRDLWVKINGENGPYQDRINSIYITQGTDELLNVVKEVLGMPVHYYVVVDFNLFRETINTLGGIEVAVDQAFVDYEYPLEGHEADTCGRTDEELKKWEESPEGERVSVLSMFPCRYETVSFDAGRQVMDGETALKYARSRKGTNGEGDDFARSHRQQKVIMAIRDKALSLETILDFSKVTDLYNTYSKNVDTNITLDDVQGFWSLSQKIEFEDVHSIVLDDRSGADEGGILYHPVDTSLYGGQWVLLPKSGDYSQIRAYVQRYIFGE